MDKTKTIASVQGVIRSINGQIAEVEITSSSLPRSYEILTSSHMPDVCLEVFYQSQTVASCLILSIPSQLHRGMAVIGTGSDLKIPVDEKLLGRVVNLFGIAQDNGPKISSANKLSLYSKAPPLNTLQSNFNVLETGIKVIDFLTPFLKGGKIGFIGGAGVGKTILITELLHNIT